MNADPATVTSAFATGTAPTPPSSAPSPALPAAAPAPEPPPSTNGRSPDGRFAAGNRGGPGNPYARQVAGLRKAMLDRYTPERMAALADYLYEQAMSGNMQAAKLIFAYTLGKPAAEPYPDRLDQHEWEGYKQQAPMMAEAPPIVQTPAPALPLELVRAARPAVTEQMRGALVQGLNQPVETPAERQRREDAEAAECERILNTPAPYPEWAQPKANENKRPARKRAASKKHRSAPKPNGRRAAPAGNGHAPPSANGNSSAQGRQEQDPVPTFGGQPRFARPA